MFSCFVAEHGDEPRQQPPVSTHKPLQREVPPMEGSLTPVILSLWRFVKLFVF